MLTQFEFGLNYSLKAQRALLIIPKYFQSVEGELKLFLCRRIVHLLHKLLDLLQLDRRFDLQLRNGNGTAPELRPVLHVDLCASRRRWANYRALGGQECLACRASRPKSANL